MRPSGDLTKNFNLTTYAAAHMRNERLFEAFEQWVHGMRPDTHGEYGPGPKGTLNWVQGHVDEQMDSPGGLYNTFILTKKDDDTKMVGTITVSSDDRGQGKLHKVDQDMMIGFLEVEPEFRRQSIGHDLMALAINNTQGWLDAHRDRGRLRMSLFTNVPLVVRMITAEGFQPRGYVNAHEGTPNDKREQIYVKDIFPAAAPV